MTGDELRRLIDEPAERREVSATAATEAFLARLESEQPRLRAMVTITPELALADAAAVDAARARGDTLPLDGMPVVVKDIVDVAGVRTTNGSRQFPDLVPETDAPAIARLRAAGAVVLGKANLHEVAFGATSANEAFGPVVNPWDAAVIPGGSSGGSGAAVAADLCLGAVGTDTGGSVRIPASCCGVSGIRPTFGAVSTRGVFPVSWELDTVGPLARGIEDVAALLAAMAGDDPGDPRSLDTPLEPLSIDEPVVADGLRIGVLRGLFAERASAEVTATVEAALAVLVDAGADLVELELPGAEASVDTCSRLIWAGAHAVHRERLARTPELFEEGTRRRLALAEQLTAGDVALLHQRAHTWRRELRKAFETVDLLATPTLPEPPPPAAGADTVETTMRVVPFTFPFAIGHVPAASVPCGLTGEGHPVGLQLVAPPRRDALALRTAAAYQRHTDWHRRRPPGV